jgi:propionate CoA-transferase
MAAGIFEPAPMNLRHHLLEVGLAERFHYDAVRRTLFLNFRHLRIGTREDVARLREAVIQACQGFDHKVAGVVNYDGFQLDEGVADDYAAMVREMEQRFYTHVTRYASGAFDRLRLAAAIHREIEPAGIGQALPEAGI